MSNRQRWPASGRRPFPGVVPELRAQAEADQSAARDCESFRVRERIELVDLPAHRAQLAVYRRAVRVAQDPKALAEAQRREAIKVKAAWRCLCMIRRYRLAVRLRMAGHDLNETLDLACLENPKGRTLQPLPEAMRAWR